jgi:hypothetical protein
VWIATRIRSIFYYFQPHKRQEAIRHRRVASLDELGYRIERRGQTNDGKKLMAGYILIAPNGDTLDNHGMGYTSSYEALRAAKRHLAAMPNDAPSLPVA